MAARITASILGDALLASDIAGWALRSVMACRRVHRSEKQRLDRLSWREREFINALFALSSRASLEEIAVH